MSKPNPNVKFFLASQDVLKVKNKKLFPGRRITHRGVGIGRPGGASIEHLKVLN